MTSQFDSNSLVDKELNRRFAMMRQQDARHLPEIFDAQVLAARSPLIVRRKSYAIIPMTAAALAAVIVTGLLVSGQSSQDPSLLYASIMSENIMATDQLMSMSPGTMPAMITTVGVDITDAALVNYPQLDYAH